ncbi:hypothetical protein HMPREF9098_0194 [Kingella denitrificans ATCC 33394]|uniref:Uncharacterized protein n=1 Tax=Kingella denitrificans ATCC 33394 TaxID=888741 RepID=F0EWG0_9NEIS|nr:hypothetical protein HMPREF9098_0194 [Kingella denitrificans ATCC 33394]
MLKMRALWYLVVMIKPVRQKCRLLFAIYKSSLHVMFPIISSLE